MKVSKTQSAQNRAAIVQAASKLFRAKGLDGIGVADLTAAAGLTHGSFYRQFASKEALFGEAGAAALEDVARQLTAMLAKPNGMERFSRAYLRPEHVQGAADCPVATLAADVSRQSPDVQAAFAEGLRTYLGAGGHELGSPEWNRDTARVATLIGTLLMARAVRLADKPLADAVVTAALRTGDKASTR